MSNHVFREKILQCGSAESKTAKPVEDIRSEYCVELKALQNLEYFKWKYLSNDSLGKSLLPTDLPSNLEAEELQSKKATSNGNCLYNSASIILNGNEDLSLLLRLLTAVELYKNAPFYATHPNSPEAASDCCLPEISLFIQFLSDWGLKVFERWSYCWIPGQKIVRNDSHDSSFNCYWQANILSLSWMQQKYSSSLSQRYFATRLWYKVTRH